ncbi:hypothetical protein CHR48_01567 [Weissella cibaria]|uniref:Uncharacterized protein n=1 Tax=Weissella cibaria TaxID=137591 RepID=A0A0D1JMX7_9LACO|nr:hypothetical protein AUC63_00523 [Weissella cibaria]APU61977.1 hypothetical protein AUC65_00128 [Weissella cibaria]APU64128.1 hypothetical protein AUC62_00121 [Weissella cibaria]ASS52490.1 hypothetical protein CHR48_01567 [Weissella cibaria]KIU22608.1 hypothetical protein QX99_00112 [Weissella cibaria]
MHKHSFNGIKLAAAVFAAGTMLSAGVCNR